MTAIAAETAALPAHRRYRRVTPGRVGLAALLAGTAALYLVGLGASGWANAYYAASAQAGASSWEAFLYGSSDAANAITVDKTPAFLWVMSLSVRLFGLDTWSLLVPQALAGVASVAVLYAAVRRWFGVAAGLLAGVVLALTPVATLMFRFDNPDALLVLLLTGAGYASLRALEGNGGRWLALAGALLGFGFLTKMLQALILVPVVVAVHLLAGAGRPWRRIRDLLLGGLALLVAGGWWVAVVELVPAAHRPYVGGTQHNSVLELTFGYNGFGRLTGDETGGLGNTNADAGPWRLFGSEMGGQIGWLLPAALILLVAVVWLAGRAPRTDRTRAMVLLWGGALVLTGAVFSLSSGIIHPYYTVALAPAIAALVAIGTVVCARRARVVLAATVAVTAVWAYVLLDRVSGWQPWLRWSIVGVGLVAALLLAAADRLSKRLVELVAMVALASGLAGPFAFSLATAATPHTGALPSAGPAGFGLGTGPGGGRGGFGNGGAGAGGRPGQNPAGSHSNAQNPHANGNARNPNARGSGGGNVNGPGGQGFVRRGGQAPTGGGRMGGSMGGLLDAGTPDAAVTRLLRAHHSRYTWVAATIGSNNAASYQLASRYPVMAVGGFNGTDAYPSLAAFEKLVAAGRIHWFIAGALTGSGSGSQSPQRIQHWVQQHYPARTVAGVTLYDLS
ncbi:glycosyltransferase family 39 protein [Actinocatenispora comari]|uniref:Glycosyl transferase n=1 Tax=Actinocatenispora comari TaxID=2807577 RepID=A0A8J4ELS5_9ACTN|nr:glycosyltransferase family 39 protein [Actinocatenispora comari]GIL25914.1 glycosyl transferase [Actinocatenispora comari]